MSTITFDDESYTEYELSNEDKDVMDKNLTL